MTTPPRSCRGCHHPIRKYSNSDSDDIDNDRGCWLAMISCASKIPPNRTVGRSCGPDAMQVWRALSQTFGSFLLYYSCGYPCRQFCSTGSVTQRKSSSPNAVANESTVKQSKEWECVVNIYIENQKNKYFPPLTGRSRRIVLAIRISSE